MQDWLLEPSFMWTSTMGVVLFSEDLFGNQIKYIPGFVMVCVGFDTIAMD